jgi:thymidylate synthase ThyX
MAKVVDPIANVIAYGPKVTIPLKRRFRDFLNPSRWFKRPGVEITPDEFVYAAANITYKDIGALREFMEMKEGDVDLEKKVKGALIKVAGAGHASMATTPGFWVFLEGTCSKLVDSVFTGARFGSSLMPSGRRIPISVDQIVVPRGIADRGGELERLYLEISERNIRLYEELQEKGVPKEEAAKIVQYGHRGGGFMFMPLETFIHFSKLVEEEPGALPRESEKIIRQIEDKMQEMGMNTTYKARKAAPRSGTVNPNIFHFRKNFAEEMIEYLGGSSPSLVSITHTPSEERDDKIRKYLERRERAFSTQEGIEQNWESLLTELDQIVGDYNNTVSVVTSTPTPWRVWGEVKRHRTLPQTAESIYHAAWRAWKTLRDKFDPAHPEEIDVAQLERILSIPGIVKKDKEGLAAWVGAFNDSMEAYKELIEMGVEESDAIMIVPRGIKLGVVKNFDLYNLSLGYMSLRLCDTAEPEMRRITEQERRIIEESDLSPEIKALVTPKCAYTGFCPELSFGRSCERILSFVDFYNKEVHDEIQEKRREEIRKLL